MISWTPTKIPFRPEGFFSYVRASGLPVVVFGASLTGEVLKEIFRREGIVIDRWCDNDKVKVGQGSFCDVPVVAVNDLPKYYSDCIVVIATKYVLDAAEQLKKLGFSRWIPCSELLRGTDAGRAVTRFTPDYVDFAVEACIVSQEKYLDQDKLFLLSVDLMITERCSLKCVSCSNLMQYYDRPVDVSVDESLRDVEDLCMVVDEINEIRVIGGDPFMNKRIHNVVDGLIGNPKINKIVIYSNGVIIPTEAQMKSLAHEKVFVIMTDYDDLSRNRDKIVSMFRDAGVRFHVQRADGWNDCSDISQNQRTEEQLKNMFLHCCVKNYTTMLGGFVFRCPFSANADRLRAIPDFPGDRMSVRGASTGEVDLTRLKADLRYYLMEKPYLQTCDFCNGRVFGGDGVIPGVQTKKPLDYVKYERPSGDE